MKKADPTSGIVGIYIGETSRSIAKRVNEHLYDFDTESFSIVKHWMNSHTDRDEAPPFKIKILRQYKDSLSRQVGEAIAILLPKDTLLNSKNKYIQDLLSPR